MRLTCSYFLLLSLTLVTSGSAQSHSGPVARFTFNNGKAQDEVGDIRPLLVGAAFTADRFGNRDHAIYLSGNELSYVSLGNSATLKHPVGSVSMWVLMEREEVSGTGVKSNPLILAKNKEGDDFFEAYCIWYSYDNKRINACLSRDSIRQVNVYGMDTFQLRKWHHLAITYDDNFLAFYVNGKLESKMPKNFRTVFDENLPVLLGATGNKKNNRFTHGIFDDIAFYDRVLSADEVRALYNAPDPNKLRILMYRILLVLGILAGISIIYLLMRYQVSRKHRKEKEKLELENTLLETELRVNRALMNPHFVFNSMNTLQNLILNQDHESANEYLVKFSKLIRKTLESNMEESISLDKEIDLLQRYLEIENMRFEENIKARIVVDHELVPSSVHVPIMMLQPFVENSIWHGLLKKHGDKNITVSFSRLNGHYVKCVVDDNGLGRKAPLQQTSENQPLATGFVHQRLKLLNSIYGLNCKLDIEDKPNGQGTRVTVILPILNEVK